MTLNWPWTAIMRSVALYTCLSEPTTKIWIKIDPYYQWRKCSPVIAVSSKIRLMRIFGGVRWRGGFKWVGSSKMAIFAYFTRYIFRTFTWLIINYYTMLCSPIVALQWHRNRWPWMTLNDHFALKSVSGSANNELTFLAFGQNCSKIWRATYILSATKL